MKLIYKNNRFTVKAFMVNITIMLTCFSSFAGTFTIGAGATTNTATSSGATPSPYGNYFEARREQFLIRVADLTGAGVTSERVITELGFNVSALNSCCGANGLTGFTISLKNTATAALTTTFETGYTQVYGPVKYNPATGWNMHAFDTYFTWDGTSNILVQVCFNDEGTEGFSQNASTYYSAAGFNATNGRSVDNDGDACGDVTTGTIGTNRVNTRLVMYNPGNMTYTSSTTTQAVTSTVVQGSSGNQIVGVEIVTNGVDNALSVTSFTFNTTGSTNPSTDISKAELYYTGSSSTFATADVYGNSLMVGTTAFNPNGVYTITLSQTLKPGTNYFWLTYSIKSTATVSNVVDAQCTSLNVGGARTPTVTNPAGTRAIVAYSSGAYGAATGGATTKVAYVTKVEFNSIQSNTGNDCSGTSYYCDYTATSTTINMAQSYTLNVSVYSDFASAGLRYATAAVYIDWNRDGDFLDASETVLSGISGPTGSAAWNTFNLTKDIVPPAGTVLGSTRMRVGANGSTATIPPPTGSLTVGEYEDYTVIIAEKPEMIYVGSTTIQNTADVNAGTTNNDVISLRVETSGEVNPMAITQLIFRTTNTTTIADISNVRIYSTGTSSTFSTSNLIGGPIAPVTSPTNMTFNPANQSLETGYNYFWITYDVNSSAPQGNVIDAECFSTTIAGVVRTPSPTSPSGNRPIIRVNMTYLSSAVTQDNVSYVAKGDVNQVIIGINITTTGSLNPINVTSFSLNTTGTSNPATDIQNARLWYTGSSSVFATGTQFGATVAAPSGSYAIGGTQTLLTGTNYFWLTYDIKATAGCNPNKVDAQCTSVTVGGSPYTPSPTTVLGDRIIDCNTPYYSQGNLVANTLASWNSQRDGSGAAPGSFSASYSFYIQNGHSMTTTANATIPYVIIEGGGYITATNLITITDLRINTNGVWHQKFKATAGTYITNFYIYNGGTWIHDNNGYLPSVNRYFSPLSNQWFYQWGGGTFPGGTSWGNVLLNGTTTGNFELGNVFNTIQGSFEWRRIGNNNYLFDARDETLNIGGDLIISGGWWKMNAGYNTALTNCNTVRTLTINVTGDLIVSAGTLEDNYCGPSGTKALLNVGGNVDISGGTVDLAVAAGQLSELNLTGGTPSVTWSQSGGTVTLGRTNIKAGKTVAMTGTKMGDIDFGLPITVESGATLNCSNYPVQGAGNFTLASGGTLGIGSAAGIVSAGASGNVQVTGTRSYNSGASYRYYEAQNPQASGNFTTTPTANTVTNLIMDKTNSTDVVNLTITPCSVITSLTLTKGILNTDFSSTYVFMLSSSSVSPAGGSANSYVDGFIHKEGSSAFDFPTGDGTRWRRTAIGAPTASSTFRAKYFYSGFGDYDIDPASGFTDISAIEYWILDRLIGTGNATVGLYFEDASASSINDCPDLRIAHFNSGNSWWENNNDAVTTTSAGCASPTTQSGNVVTNANVTVFSPFTFGSKSLLVNPFPIELLNFNAHFNGEDVDLIWVTVSETNNDFFTIERASSPSPEGDGWGEVIIIDGAGTSNETRNYAAIDRDPYYGISYYRLKQTDFNGRYTYSNIVAVNIARTYNFFIHPNPAKNKLNISFASTDETSAEIQVTNILGKPVIHLKYSGRKGENSIPVDIRSLPQGLYFIKVASGNDTFMEKFVKE
ncbi:MAG: T9SS type A sorting domain-containing protein [Bacteroidetes bacterium]|nr:T9SS type A sorting domain-containing protein [Bacteroidota bacterium]